MAAGARKPVVVGNGMEGEPLSHKDAVLLTRNPHLVLDGLEVLARAMHAKRAILAVGPEIDPAAALAAARGRKVEVVQLEGGFIAGQETALVNQLDGRPALPRDPFTRVTESGVGGRPTLVLNAETLAQVALVARHGAAWFRSAGTADDPGTSLFTVTGSVSRPGVVEADRGSALRDVLAAAQPVRPTAVLVGGYHGAWVPESSLDVRLTRSDLAPFNAAVGAGVLHVLDDGTCPLGFAAEVVDYLAEASARQCGPCLNGLPHLAKNLHRLAAGVRDPQPARRDRADECPDHRARCVRAPGRQRSVRRVDARRLPRPRVRPPRGLVPQPDPEGVVKTRLHVDWTRCDGHGSCAELLPASSTWTTSASRCRARATATRSSRRATTTPLATRSATAR